MKNLVVFTGAGVSAESGIRTFRDSDGLWEQYNIMDVATPEAWKRQPEVVLEFYNARRKQVLKAQPNLAHKIIAQLASLYNVSIITQNIDDLHERAGSKNVLHLHGEVNKARSCVDYNLLYDITDGEIKWGDLCERGSQLRPHVVWFGEAVPAMIPAEEIVSSAEILIVVGTSLNVYPAAGLVSCTRRNCEIYLIDPGEPLIPHYLKITWLKENASTGMKKVQALLSKSLG